jgi:alkylation response protein AidB-like acyl-CoA dehydrogenase
VALAALAGGVARASAEYAREYAKQRVQFGVPIATKQAIAFMLAEAAIEVDAARLMVWEAAWKLDQAERRPVKPISPAYSANRPLWTVTKRACKPLGRLGFIREYPVERWLRNARGFAMFHGLAMV